MAKAIREDNPAWQKPRLRYSNEATMKNIGFRVSELLHVVGDVKNSSQRYGSEYFKVGLVALFTSMRLKDVCDLTNDSLDRRNWKITFVQSKVKNILKARKSSKTSKSITIDVCNKLKDIFNQIPVTKKGNLFDVPKTNPKSPTKAVTTAYLRAFKRCGIKRSIHSATPPQQQCWLKVRILKWSKIF